MAAQMIDLDRCTQRVVARVLGVSDRTVRKWNPPMNADGTYSLRGVVAWRLAMVETAAVDEEEDGDKENTPLKRAQAKVAEHRGELLAIELAERRGELVAVEDVRRQVGAAASVITAAVSQMPGVLPGKLVGLPAEEIAQELAEYGRDMLESMRTVFQEAGALVEEGEEAEKKEAV